MNMEWIKREDFAHTQAAHLATTDLRMAERLVAAADGDVDAFYDLGVAFSTGGGGLDCDLVEAHKWFNLASSYGHDQAQLCRADISEEMTASEIAEAQKRAREWLNRSRPKAA